MSGPTGSPKAGATSLFGGAGTLGLIDTTYPTYSGGLATGIGMGPGNANNSPTLTQGEATIPSADLAPNTITALPPLGSRDFIDDLLIGVRAAWIPSGATGNPAKPTNFDSEMVYLGGGRSAATGI